MDQKSKMLELLLDEDTNEFISRDPSYDTFSMSKISKLDVTLEDLIGGMDPLDDILNELSTTS